MELEITQRKLNVIKLKIGNRKTHKKPTVEKKTSMVGFFVRKLASPNACWSSWA
jgi:hypothetical protein